MEVTGKEARTGMMFFKISNQSSESFDYLLRGNVIVVSHSRMSPT